MIGPLIKIRTCTIVLLGAILFAQTSGASEGAMTCSLTDFARLCSELPDTEAAFVDLPGGLIMSNPNGTQTPGALSAQQTQRARQRLQERFAWVKRQMLLKISSGRPVSQLDSVKTEFFKRIQSLELIINEDCRGSDALGGRYVRTQHKISICVHNGLTSDAQLTWLLAHEAGHAVDGCTVQCEHYHRKQALPNIDNASGVDTNRAIGEMNTSDYFTAGFGSVLSRPEEIDSRLSTWESQGLIERTAEGVAPVHYPLTPALSCLVNENFITAEAARVKEGAECNRGGTVSETTSDMWGASLAGEYLKSHPPRTSLERLASLSKASIALMCSKRTGPKPLPDLDSSWENQRPSEHRYINDRDRDEATLLADPNIQRALGCSPQPGRQTCQGHFEQAFAGSRGAPLDGPQRSQRPSGAGSQQRGSSAQGVD